MTPVLIACCAYGMGVASESDAITTQVRPLDARHSPYVGGNASPRLPAGQQGRVVVVARGQSEYVSIPIVVRNNSTRTVTEVRVRAVATTPSGEVITTGSSSVLQPFLVRPGEIAFGEVYFRSSDPLVEDVELPSNARFKFTVLASSRTNFRDLVVARSSLVVDFRAGDSVVGLARNARPMRVKTEAGIVACFTRGGDMLYTYKAGFDQAHVRAHGTLRFRLGVFAECPVYLVAVGGRV